MTAPTILQTLHTRKPFIPSSIATFITTFIRSRRMTSLTAVFAARWLIQGTKKEVPGLKLAQLMLYVTVSIFIACQRIHP